MSFHTRRWMLTSSLLALGLWARGASPVGADVLFDDEERSTGADDEDAGANSRADNHHTMHSDLAREVMSIADIKGIGFEIAQRSKPK